MHACNSSMGKADGGGRKNQNPKQKTQQIPVAHWPTSRPGQIHVLQGLWETLSQEIKVVSDPGKTLNIYLQPPHAQVHTRTSTKHNTPTHSALHTIVPAPLSP